MITFYLWKKTKKYLVWNELNYMLSILLALLLTILTIPLDIILLPLELLSYIIYIFL